MNVNDGFDFCSWKLNKHNNNWENTRVLFEIDFLVW